MASGGSGLSLKLIRRVGLVPCRGSMAMGYDGEVVLVVL